MSGFDAFCGATATHCRELATIPRLACLSLIPGWMGLPALDITVALTWVGRLPAMTKLLDMTLRTEDVNPFGEQFFQETINASDQ